MINRLIEPTSGRILLGEDDVTRVNPVSAAPPYRLRDSERRPLPASDASRPTWRPSRGCSAGTRSASTRGRPSCSSWSGSSPKTFAKRYPAQLSGGQRQRVGVARALGADPPVLLMDEPFSAIDPIARTRLQDEFLRVQREVRKTIVFVTHDLDEAVRLADRIAIFRQGGIPRAVRHPCGAAGLARDRFRRRFRRRPARAAPAFGDPHRPGATGAGGLVTRRTGGPAVAARFRTRWRRCSPTTADTCAWSTSNGQSVGMLTVAGVHAALRRSVHEAERGASREAPSSVVD